MPVKRTVAAIAILAGTAFAQDAGRPPAVNVLEFGAVADGSTDCAPAIQAAIDAVSESGGQVVIPPAPSPYLIRSGITIAADDVLLIGEGATIRFADRAMNGRIIDCVQILGTEDDPAENITIRGLSIDANYWAQPGSYNPRGLDSDHARNILLERVTVSNAFVAVTFGKDVHDSEARDCVVRNWYDDGFNASGDGFNSACSDIRFVRCIAENAANEIAGGPPGERNNAWEIEDGASDVILTDCVVRNCSGNGFAVRNHGWSYPVHTARVRFFRCRAENVAGHGFRVFGSSYPNTVEEIYLEDCSTDSFAYFRGVLGLTIRDSAFTGTTRIGPARDCRVDNTVFAHLRLWALRVGEPNDPAAYQSTFYLDDQTTIANPPSVFGDRHFARLPNDAAPIGLNP